MPKQSVCPAVKTANDLYRVFMVTITVPTSIELPFSLKDCIWYWHQPCHQSIIRLKDNAVS